MSGVLGKAITGTLEADEIETWPLPTNVDEVSITGGELQARCPVTGNPDIYDYAIDHGGTRECESKALKMYLLRYRDEGISCASLASTIADDLTMLLRTPVSVSLDQQTRGGMRLHARATGVTRT